MTFSLTQNAITEYLGQPTDEISWSFATSKLLGKLVMSSRTFSVTIQQD